MGLFQTSILKNYLKGSEDKIETAYENISIHLPKQLKSESANCEEQITKKLYSDYELYGLNQEEINIIEK